MTKPRATSSFAEALRELWQILRQSNGPYRPERHYMRGPGPKWHAVHGAPYAPVELRAAGQRSAMETSRA
jgi:hypothetical protein